MAKNKHDVETDVEEVAEKETPKAGKGERVVVNFGEQNFTNDEFGNIGPKESKSFPAEYAERLIRLSDGQVQFADAKAEDVKKAIK